MFDDFLKFKSTHQHDIIYIEEIGFMNVISYKDRIEIQKHLSAVWDILYKNGAKDDEYHGHSLDEFLITYNPDNPSVIADGDIPGFRLCVSDHETCWHQLDFEETEAEKQKRSEGRKQLNADLNQLEVEEKKKEELERDEMAEYWSKECASRPDLYGDFERMMFRWNWPKEIRDKYIKKYDVVDNADRDDPCKLAEEYLNNMFEDDAWKSAFYIDGVNVPKTVDEYLDAVRNFIEMQEKYNMHGESLYALNEARTSAHIKMLEHFGLNEDDMDSEVARYITQNMDFIGKYDARKNKTTFYPEYEASARLAYALTVVKMKAYIR